MLGLKLNPVSKRGPFVFHSKSMFSLSGRVVNLAASQETPVKIIQMQIGRTTLRAKQIYPNTGFLGTFNLHVFATWNPVKNSHM